MVFTIQRDVVLLCAGEPPSSGPDDARFVVPGDKTFPPVKVWPGFKLLRSVLFEKILRLMLFVLCGKARTGLFTSAALTDSTISAMNFCPLEGEVSDVLAPV